MQRHLDTVELDALAQESRAGEGERRFAGSTITQQARIHLAGCDDCGRRLRMYWQAQNELETLRRGSVEAAAGCPDARAWMALAGGYQEAAESGVLRSHAEGCSRCARALAQADALLAEETTAEEEELLREVASSSPDWQLARVPRMGEEAAPVRGRLARVLRYRTPFLLVTAAAIALVVGVVAVRKLSPSPAEMIAKGYAEDRTLDLRLAGAAYGPRRATRGGGSSVELPLVLERALVKIDEGLRRKPNDAELLDAKARISLIEGQPETAMRLLETAMDGKQDAPGLMTDMASALVVEGEQTGDPRDYAQAIELLSRVLQAQPREPVALFNRALANEYAENYHAAAEDWRAFLGVEKDPGWRSEAETHLRGVEQKLGVHPAAGNEGEDRPEAALAAMRAGGQDPVMDEVYLAEATPQWLAAEARQGKSGGVEAEALHALGERLARRHQDGWLNDLLAAPRTATWKQGVQELAAAMQARATGDLPGLAEHAEGSLRAFQHSGNEAGKVAATYEELLGANLAVRADRCGSIARGVSDGAGMEGYPWFRANLLFEEATCHFMTGDEETALGYARRAAELGDRFRYKGIELKGTYFLDGVVTTAVVRDDAWRHLQQGMEEFWRSPYPASAGQGFYADAGYAAESEGWWHAAEAAFRESLMLRASQHDRYVLYGAHHRLAKAAEAAGDVAVADEEYRAADAMAAELGPGAERTRIELAIERAELEVTQHRLGAAQTQLEKVAASLTKVSNHYALVPYLTSMGELALEKGDPDRAESELQKAIGLVEKDESSLRSDADRLTWQREMAKPYRSLLRLYLQYRHDDVRALALLEWYRAGPLRAQEEMRGAHVRRVEQTGSPPWLSAPAEHAVPTLQKFSLPPQTALLTWITFPTGISILEVDASGIHTASTPVPDILFTETARRLNRLCSTPGSSTDSIHLNARKLYGWLVKPVEGHLTGVRHLVIEPDDVFSTVPFELLEDAQGTALGDRFAVGESPGWAYYGRLREAPRVSAQSVTLAVGAPLMAAEAASAFRPLPEAATEAGEVAQRFSTHVLLTGKDAELSKIVDAMPRAEVFHFAGHAVARGSEAGLVVAAHESGAEGMAVLGANQLSTEDLQRLKLVVLSGCETGVAQRGLVDPQSLVRVFLRAGVPEVVASRWPVDSRASAVLMERFYGELMQGRDVEEALALARAAVRASPQTADPYYWAAFTVFGR